MANGEHVISHRKMVLTLLVFLIITFISKAAFGLQCFVGLGNESYKNKMKVVECPEGKHYVCVKMFGGGMGDQIRRYCESIPRHDYYDLLDKEEQKILENLDTDPACYQDVHNGRDVKVCICSGDKCNSASFATPTTLYVAVAFVTASLWPFPMKHIAF